MSKQDGLREQCWNRALEAYGTAYIFEQRASRYRSWLRKLTYVGIAVPALIGVAVMSFLSSSWFNDLLPILVGSASILLIIQFLVSIWAVVSHWQDEQSYATESANDNFRLSSLYKELAKAPPESESDFRRQYELLSRDDQYRSREDYKHNISDKEKRIGMRAGLRQFNRACASCGEVPTSMDATDCDVCGNF